MNLRRTGAVVLLIPMLMLLVVPVISHAQSNYYYLEVECENEPGSHQTDVVSIVFLGHFALVTCGPGSENDKEVSFASSASGTYSGQALAGNQVESQIGSFSPYGTGYFCEVQGGTLGPGYQSISLWFLWNSYCD